MNRIEMSFLVEAKNCNPNGNPDDSNSPRVDENGHGFITDVCLKRKIRDEVNIVYKDKAPNAIMISKKNNYSEIVAANSDADLLKNYWDNRSFGLVITRGKKDKSKDKKEREEGDLQGLSAQIRGPVAFTHSVTIDKVSLREEAITRTAAANKDSGENTIGRKSVVPYGLYLGHITIDPHCAEKTGFSKKDYEIFLQSLENIFLHDDSSGRQLNLRGLWVFEHDNPLGNAPKWKVFESLAVEKKVETPTKFSDYSIKMDDGGLKNIKVTQVI